MLDKNKKTPQYNDNFNELKKIVKERGLSDRVPIRGVIEMIGTISSLLLVYLILYNWENIDINKTLLSISVGIFMSIIFTRAVFISHDILHLQYFKNKKLSFKLSYPFAAIIISNSSSWWDFKHNVNHHTWCNVPEKDVDITAFDGAFTNGEKKGNKKLLKNFKYLIFWGASFFMHISFIIQSYSYALKNQKYGEFILMLLHWPIIWGPVFYFLPLTDALIILLTLHLTLSPWLFLGFIPNHFGMETFSKEESNKLSWMELQIRTSRSLSGGIFSHWFYGGLNTQIEHHLFPKAPRFNLLEIRKITKEFAKENNIDYLEVTPLQSYIDINKVLKKY